MDPGAILLTDQPTTLDPLLPLIESHGALTALEIFLALAPEGDDPHPALIEAHEREARAMGRADTSSVRVVDGRGASVDQQLVEKQSTGCTGSSLFPFIAPLTYTSQEFASVTLPETEVFLCTGSPPVVDLGTPSGCQQHSQGKLLVAIACVSQRSDEAPLVHFFLNRAPDLGAFVEPPGSIRALLLPEPDPGPIGRSLAVQVRNGPSGQNLSVLMTGVGELLD